MKTIKQHIANNDFGKAFDLYDTCQQQNVEVALDDITALTLIWNLLESNRIADARQIVSDLSQSIRSTSPKDATPILYDIFQTLGTQVDSEEFNWFTNRLIFTQTTVDEKLLGNLMDIVLNVRCDVKLGIQIFTKIAKEWKKVPWLEPLLMKCINSSDSDDLKKVVQVASSVIGTKNIRHNLAFAYVEVGHITEANKLYASMQMNDRDMARIEEHTAFRRKRRDKAYLDNLLAATKDSISKKCRVRIFEALLILHEKDVDQIQELCQLMEAENIRPKTDMEAILSSFYKHNIRIPKQWQQSLISEESDDSSLDAANTFLIDSFKSHKRIAISTIMNVIRRNAAAGNVLGMDLLRVAIPEKIKSRADFYSNECRAYMSSNRHMEYVEIIQWEIGNRQTPNLPAIIIDLIMDCPPVYDRCRSTLIF